MTRCRARRSCSRMLEMQRADDIGDLFGRVSALIEGLTPSTPRGRVQY